MSEDQKKVVVQDAGEELLENGGAVEFVTQTVGTHDLFEPLPEVTESVVTEEKACEPVVGHGDGGKSMYDLVISGVVSKAGFDMMVAAVSAEAQTRNDDLDEIDAEYIESDPDVVSIETYNRDIDALYAKIDGLELINKELSEASADGAKTIRAFIAYRKWVLSLGQKFSGMINGTLGWREKIAASKKFANELIEAAAQFDIGLTTDVETEEDKAAKKKS